MLPFKDGWKSVAVARHMAVPIIMLTKEEEADKIKGLEIGADDYVTNL